MLGAILRSTRPAVPPARRARRVRDVPPAFLYESLWNALNRGPACLVAGAAHDPESGLVDRPLRAVANGWVSMGVVPAGIAVLVAGASPKRPWSRSPRPDAQTQVCERRFPMVIALGWGLGRRSQPRVGLEGLE